MSVLVDPQQEAELAAAIADVVRLADERTACLRRGDGSEALFAQRELRFAVEDLASIFRGSN